MHAVRYRSVGSGDCYDDLDVYFCGDCLSLRGENCVTFCDLRFPPISTSIPSHVFLIPVHSSVQLSSIPSSVRSSRDFSSCCLPICPRFHFQKRSPDPLHRLSSLPSPKFLGLVQASTSFTTFFNLFSSNVASRSFLQE